METYEYSTNSMGQSQRFAFWRDVVCDSFVELDFQPNVGRGAFRGEIVNRRLSNLQLSYIRADAHASNRTPSMISRSNEDFYLLSLALDARIEIRQAGNVAMLDSGCFALYDTTIPYEKTMRSDFSQLVLRIERQEIDSRIIDPYPLLARAVGGSDGIGRVAGQFVTELATQADRIAPDTLKTLSGHALDLVVEALTANTPQEAATASLSQQMILRRVARFVDANLQNPSLSCAGVAEAMGVSQRYLRKIFESADKNLSDWIWQRRLERSRHDLADIGVRSKQITTIAYDWGFKDPAHFSKAFKARFGMTPREYRRIAPRSI